MCGLQMHPTKTKIVYCKDNRRRGDYPNVMFDFCQVAPKSKNAAARPF